MTLSTHVLDTEAGRPAPGMPVTASILLDGEWSPRGTGVTDADGRTGPLVADADWQPGHWRVVFETAGVFYPLVTIEFLVAEPAGHHHIPLLLTRHGYTTYRGS